MSIIAALLLSATAHAGAPLSITVTDSRVLAVVLDCGGSTMKAVVKSGKADFSEVPHGSCTVDFVRKSGTISGAGEWTCSLDTCTQEDVQHLEIKDADGRLNVVVSDLPDSTTLELKCPNGFRERAHVKVNTAIFDNVPNEQCTLYFKGGVPAKYNPLNWGTYYCSISGTTAVCSKKKA